MPSGLSQSHQEIAGQFQWEPRETADAMCALAAPPMPGRGIEGSLPAGEGRHACKEVTQNWAYHQVWSLIAFSCATVSRTATSRRGLAAATRGGDRVLAAVPD